MKIKNCFKYLIIFCGILAFANIGFADDSVPITGTAYSDKIGLIHFDYKTACLEDPANPSQCLPKTNPAYNNPAYYIGPTKQFYVSPYNAYYLSGTPFKPADSSTATRINTKANDPLYPQPPCQNCAYLQGFAWSDKLGWISFDGKTINNSILDNGKPAMSKDYYPKISTSIITDASDSNKKKVALSGFAWNEHTGWIMLSSNISGDTGVIKATESQSKTEFGLWLDAGMDPERVDVSNDPNLAVQKTEKLGRRINGYAWSEKLGWIKFSPSASDTDTDLVKPGIQTDPLFTSYTLWIPDTTPPIVLAQEKLWFSVGVNTHYPDITKMPENIVWNEFAMDPESGMNQKDSKIYLQKVAGDSNNCLGVSSLIQPMQYDLPDLNTQSPPVNVNYNDLGVGDAIRLIMPNLGVVKNVPRGYCKYELHALLVNDTNKKTYIGNPTEAAKTLIPNPSDPATIPSNPHPPDNKEYFAPIIVYVRAGDYSYKHSSVVATPTSPSAFADGNDPVKYKIDLLDIAQNPVVDIKCDATDICPVREVAVIANVTNELLYDLTQPTNTEEIRPVFYTVSPNSSLPFSEDDDNIYEKKINGITVLSWPIRKYNASNKWDIEITEESDSSYPLTLTSFAPSGTFCKAELGCVPNPGIGVFTKSFSFNSFNYKVYNEKLPEVSKKLKKSSVPGGPPYQFDSYLDTELQAPTCYDDDPLDATLPACKNIPFPNPLDPLRVATPGKIGTGSTALAVEFKKPIVTDSPVLSGEITGAKVITMSTPATIEFSIRNLSPKVDLITTGADDKDGGFSIDNIFQYYTIMNGKQVQAPGMVSQRISNFTPSDPENATTPTPDLAWTDPFEYCFACTRYEMYMQGGKNRVTNIEPIEPKNSPFVKYFTRISGHGTYKFFFNDDPVNQSYKVFSTEVGSKGPSDASFVNSLPSGYLANEIGDDGRYAISGNPSLSIPIYFSKFNPPLISDPKLAADPTYPFNYPAGFIDRSDPVIAELPKTSGLVKKTVRFFPEQVGSTVTNDPLKFRLVQEIAYRFPEQNIYTTYAIDTPLLDGVEVKDTGLEARGTVAGKQIVTGREFDVVGTAGTKKLQEQMRRNVAEMIAGIPNPSTNCTIPLGNLSAFNTTESTCVILDKVNNAMFAYYEGDSTKTLTLANGTNDLLAPPMPYTIIVKGGANVFIKNNIKYQSGSSFGIIVIAAEIGKGANVYLSPAPTNVSAVVYAEGSLLSMSDSGKLYYGGPTAPLNTVGEISDLKNQLYWKGSIASRNTIAGAGQNKIPEGVICPSLLGDTVFTCAQRYDLDYLRRFTPVVDANGSQIANKGLFSGGGCCGIEAPCGFAAGQCKLGTTGLPTVIKLIDNLPLINQIDMTSQLATVYVEKDPATVNNPPPGFSVTFGLESTQEIR